MQTVRIVLITLLSFLAGAGFVWLTWDLLGTLGTKLLEKLAQRRQGKAAAEPPPSE